MIIDGKRLGINKNAVPKETIATIKITTNVISSFNHNFMLI